MFQSLHWEMGGRANVGMLVRGDRRSSQCRHRSRVDGHSVGNDYVHEPGVRICVGRCPGRYVPSLRAHQYLLGPRFSFPLDETFDVFAHTLTVVIRRTTDGIPTPASDSGSVGKKGLRLGLVVIFRPRPK